MSLTNRLRCVLFEQTDVFGSRIGGAETFFKGVIRYAPRDFDVSVVGTTADPKSRPMGKWSRTEFRGREIAYFPVVAEEDENKKSRVPLSLRYTFALRRRRFDFRGAALLFNRIEHSLAFGRASAAKFVVIHNDVVAQIMEGRSSESIWTRMPWIYQQLEAYAIRRVDHVYAVSESSVRYFRGAYPTRASAFSFLPTWLDPEIFSPSARPKAELRAEILPELPVSQRGGRWLLFVGRLQEQKAPLRVLDAFAHYLALDCNAVLILVGDGNLRERVLKEATARGLRSSIVHVPFLPQSRLVDFYRAADVLVLASNYEGMPISVLEALGCGLPVVSTRVGEVPRVVRDGASGEVVGSSDPTTLANALRAVTGAPEKYCAKHCIDSVRDFLPEKVLAPVFEAMAERCRQIDQIS